MPEAMLITKLNLIIRNCINNDIVNKLEGNAKRCVDIYCDVMLQEMSKEVKKAVALCKRAGIKTVMITGDHVLTAGKIARDLNISKRGDEIVTGVMLDAMSDEELKKNIGRYNVFARVSPAHKLRIVKAYRENGEVVAMTGDGVNDVLALKDADCSIAMASGSDAAANVSDLVLLDSNFACMPSVVAEGRRVINNIERSASLFLVKNIFSFILTLLALISASMYPFKPAQLSLVSALMIGIPSFFLALEPNTDMVKGKFLRNVLFRECTFKLFKDPASIQQ